MTECDMECGPCACGAWHGASAEPIKPKRDGARIYICGPMSALPDFNFPAFNAAAEQWRDCGYHVKNPAETFGGRTNLPRSMYMRTDFHTLLDSQAVAVLPGWEGSPGASLEVSIARELAMPVLDARYPNEDWESLVHITSDLAPPTRCVMCQASITHGFNCDICTDILALGGRKSRMAMQGFIERSEGVDGGGYKASMDDPAKPPMALIPRSVLLALGRSLGHGAAKYAPNNYRRGMNWSEPYSAILRHLSAWLDGEDIDADSGLNHLDNAAAMLAFLIEYVAHPGLYAKFDDRYKRPVGE